MKKFNESTNFFCFKFSKGKYIEYRLKDMLFLGGGMVMMLLEMPRRSSIS